MAYPVPIPSAPSADLYFDPMPSAPPAEPGQYPPPRGAYPVPLPPSGAYPVRLPPSVRQTKGTYRTRYGNSRKRHTRKIKKGKRKSQRRRR